MKKTSFQLTFLFLFLSFNASTQECDCLSQFLYTKNYIETNNPAFQKIKNNSTEYKIYQNQVKNLTNLTKKETSIEHCVIHLEKYFSLLKDNHSGIELNISRLPLNFNSKSAIDSFKLTKNYQSFEKLKIDTTTLISALKLKSEKDLSFMDCKVIKLSPLEKTRVAMLVMEMLKAI